MKIRTNFKSNDKGKLDVELIHEFRPLENNSDVVLTLQHILNAEIQKYMDTDDKSFDFIRMFKAKVKEVRGIVMEDADGREVPCTVDDIVNIPCKVFNEIIIITCAHLINSYSLNDNERKN